MTMSDIDTLTESDEPVAKDEAVEVELTPQEAEEYVEPQDQVAKQVDEEEEDREAIRERRRLEKQERKQRRQTAINRDKIELEFLRKRNDDLERRVMAVEQKSQQNDLSLYDQKIREATNEVQLAEKVIAKAVAAGNGEDVTQAMRYRDQAIIKAQQLQFAKKQAQETKPAEKPPVDDISLAYAKEFIEDHSWYDPQGKDESSAIVLAIDNTLVKEGFNPRSQEYWDELRDRIRRRIPEKFEVKPERQARGGPQVGSGREHAPSSTRREVYISPERKAALIEAGVWDDPTLRQKYIKKYMEYDRRKPN
jgi:hypothetical protein